MQGDVIGIADVIQIITDPVMKGIIDDVRESPELYQQRKMGLPYITVNGVFAERNENGLLEYSGVTCIDFDHIPNDEMTWMKDCLRKWPYTFFLFTSPSGEGLKLFIKHDLNDPSLHNNMYMQMLTTFRDEWGCQYVDTNPKDLSRATFLTYDPDYFWNPDALSWHFVYDPSVHETVQHGSGGTGQAVKRDSPMTPGMIAKNSAYQTSWADITLVRYIDKHQWDAFREDYKEGHRNDSILRKAGLLFRCGVHYDVALEKLIHLYSEAFSDMPPSEVESRVHYIYSMVPEGDYGCKRHEWLAKRNAGVAGFLGNNKQ